MLATLCVLMVMTELLFVVVIASFFQCLILEVSCRFQVRIITLPRTTLNLTKHYLALLPYIALVISYVKLIKYLIGSLGFSSINEALLLLGCVVGFIIPVIYFMDYRYKRLVNKIEAWRKNT